MKKKYTTPASTAISIRTASLLSGSGNEYGKDQGHVSIDNSSFVDASDGD